MPSSDSMYVYAVCVWCKLQYIKVLHVCSVYINHAVAPDVLLKYRLAEEVGGRWEECSRCLELSDHQVHDIQSWYTSCVERSYAVLDIFHEQCEKKSKSFVAEVEKRMSCLPQFQEVPRVLKNTDHLPVEDLCTFMQYKVSACVLY